MIRSDNETNNNNNNNISAETDHSEAASLSEPMLSLRAEPPEERLKERRKLR